MSAPAVEAIPNVFLVSTHASFRAHVDEWLRSPTINVVEVGPENLAARAREYPPALLVLDRQLPDTSQLLSRAAAIMPGMPYLIVSTDRLDVENPYLFDIASGYVAKGNEEPSRASVVAAIAKVAPRISSRLG